jgi:hypothetical protein
MQEHRSDPTAHASCLGEPEEPSVDAAARGIMSVLLASDYNGPWAREDLERQMSSPALTVMDALLDLQAEGLVHIFGEIVFASHAARRMDDLDL